MKNIHLKTEKDLKRLLYLRGNECICLKVYPTFHPKHMEAIDLQHFSGTIRVNFIGKRDHRPILVLAEKNSKKNWIFQNVSSSLIECSKQSLCSVKYHYSPSIIPVFEEENFLSSKRQKVSKISFQLFQDVICKKAPSELFGNSDKEIKILGNGQSIYFPKTGEWLRFFERHTITFQGVTPIMADQMISISSKEDLQKLRYLSNGVVVVALENNLHGIELESISLKNFIGTMLFYGKGHHLDNITLHSNEKSVGLFSSVHPSSTLKFYDVVMSEISFCPFGFQESYGAFLGSRESVPNSAFSHFMPGGISFSNCHVLSAFFPTSQHTTHLGYFVGFGDDAMDFYKCYGMNGSDCKGQFIHNYVGKEAYFLTSLGNVYEKSYYRERKKIKLG